MRRLRETSKWVRVVASAARPACTKQLTIAALVSAIALAATGCLGASPVQAVRMSAPGPNGTTIRIFDSYVLSSSDADPGPDWLYEVKLHARDTAKTPYVLRLAGPRTSLDGPGGYSIGGYADPDHAVYSASAIGDIDHRAVGQSGAEIVNEQTGDVLCAGIGDLSDSFQIDNYWMPPYDLHMVLSLHCDDPSDPGHDLTLAATGRLDFGGYGAL